MSETQSPIASARTSTHRQQLQMTQELEEALSVYSSNKDKKLDELREIVASQYVEHIDELDYYSKYHLIGLIIRNAIYKTEVPLLKNSAIQFWNNVALKVKKLIAGYNRSNLLNAETALKTAMAKELMTAEALEEELDAQEAEKEAAEEAERARVLAVRKAEMDEEREKKSQAAWAKMLRNPVRHGMVSTFRSMLSQPRNKTVAVTIGGKRKRGKQTRKRRNKFNQHKYKNKN